MTSTTLAEEPLQTIDLLEPPAWEPPDRPPQLAHQIRICTSQVPSLIPAAGSSPQTVTSGCAPPAMCARP